MKKSHNHAAWQHSDVVSKYKDGGKEVRFGAREGADPNLCDCTVYLCPHGVEHREGLPIE